MNKVDPDVVVDDFITTIRSSHRDWQTIDIALTAQPVAIKRKAATDSFLQLAVTWESFMSDWWVAAINRDSTTFVATLEARLRGYAKRDMRLDPTADLAATLITKAHLDLEAVRRLLDPGGTPNTASSRSMLESRALAMSM